ncbi:hypothetical protein [Streptomyces xanthii]|uniref:Uncharacterized protein n=1 Tax=Streptomyces xanthii TaxID=2768069 RepID=A0A7H1BL41_9ACTN|nr:hypothetical protein [Streptomyces xanthii]QNS09446.1 hypothetical protein IAG42_37435 [Streptomyces xanthii]
MRYALAETMAQDYRAGLSEEEIVKKVLFTASKDDALALLHSGRLTHDALRALYPWMQEPDGPMVLFPHGTRAPTVLASWEDTETADDRRLRLRGLDEALRAAGIGYRDPATKQPRTEEDLVRGGQAPELFFLATPDLVESVHTSSRPES